MKVSLIAGGASAAQAARGAGIEDATLRKALRRKTIVLPAEGKREPPPKQRGKHQDRTQQH